MSRLEKIQPIVLGIILASGWKRAGIALIAGALSALAMAPFHAWPVLFITFPVMVWLIDGISATDLKFLLHLRQGHSTNFKSKTALENQGGKGFRERLGSGAAAAMAGWWFGFGYFLAGLYWIGYAFLVDADIFGWLLPFAVTALPAGLALFMAFGFGVARMIWSRDAYRILSLAIGLTISEWLRGHVLTGFPWNAFGYALTEPLALAQTASLTGLWGLTFLSVMIFASPAVLVNLPPITRQSWVAPTLAALTLVAMGAYGTIRLGQEPMQLVENVKLRVMQPNLQQNMKFNYSAKQAVMQKYLELSSRGTKPTSTEVKDATILIWPESAFPFFLTREADAMAQITSFLPEKTTLITGAIRPPDTPPGMRITRAYNSIYAIDHDGTILGIYDKLHLVPFGEYLPFQEQMEKLGFIQLTQLRGGYIPGLHRRMIELPHAPHMLPLICYEAIFPGNVVPRGDVRPGWIVNVTNDGWFGISTGPYQHLQQARIRAIEEGLPIIRAANTGISAIIDPFGNIVAKLNLGVEGVLDSGLPSAIPPPLYARIGDLPMAVAITVSAIFVVRRRSS